jgi:hypothetical protein
MGYTLIPLYRFVGPTAMIIILVMFALGMTTKLGYPAVKILLDGMTNFFSWPLLVMGKQNRKATLT